MRINSRILVISLCFFCSLFLSRILYSCDHYAVHQELFFTGNGFPDNGIVSIVEGPNEKVFVGLKDKGVVLFEKGKVTRAWKGEAMQSQKIETKYRMKAMAVDGEGQLWVGTAGGLFLLNGNDLKEKRAFHADEKAFSDNIIQSVTESKGITAIGTTRGLAIQKTGGWNFFTEKDGLPSNLVNSVALDSGGKIIAGTSNGLAIKDSAIFKKESLDGHWVNAVIPNLPPKIESGESFRNIIRFTLKSLLEKLEKAIPERTDVKEKDFEKSIIAIKKLLAILNSDSDQPEFFAASNKGVFLFNLQNKKTEEVIEGWSTSLAMDSAGNLFAGQKGLKVKPFVTIPNFIESFEVQDMIREQGRRILSNQNSSFSAFLEMKTEPSNSLTSKNQKTGDSVDPVEALEKLLIAAEISSLYVDPHGIMWVGTSNVGLFKFQPITVNAELPIGILRELNCAKGTDPEDKAQFEYYQVNAKMPSIDAEIQGLILQAISKWTQPGEFSLWVGRWSQLTPEDRENFLSILAKNGDPYHLEKYVPLFFYDSYVVLPIGPREKEEVGKVKTLKP
ncbi:hypothetical protein HYY75_03610 [bacterium]|nr:hypothetical protein [bacterium]